MMTLTRSGLSIIVRNPGQHISQKGIRNWFRPGFTTKQNQHQGLGFSMVREQVERYDGSIQVTSKAEKVNVFTVSLPMKALLQDSN